MAIAPGTKDITQDIISSYDERVAEVGKMKDEVDEMRGAFQASHSEMRAQLRKDLAKSRAQIEHEVGRMRKGFRRSLKEMGTQMRKELAQGAADREGEVEKMRSGFRQAQKEMRTQLRKDLAQDKERMEDEVDELRASFQASHSEMGAQLRRELADYCRGIKSEVEGVRQETRADLGEAGATWQELASTMQAKRAGVRLPKAKRPVRAEEEIPETEAAAPKEKMLDIETKLLAAIEEHIEGITLAKAAERLGVAPIALGRVSRILLDKGKIRKAAKLYFPEHAK